MVKDVYSYIGDTCVNRSLIRATWAPPARNTCPTTATQRPALVSDKDEFGMPLAKIIHSRGNIPSST